MSDFKVGDGVYQWAATDGADSIDDIYISKWVLNEHSVAWLNDPDKLKPEYFMTKQEAIDAMIKRLEEMKEE